MSLILKEQVSLRQWRPLELQRLDLKPPSCPPHHFLSIAWFLTACGAILMLRELGPPCWRGPTEFWFCPKQPPPPTPKHNEFPALGGLRHTRLFPSFQLSTLLQHEFGSRNSLVMGVREGIEEVKGDDKAEETCMWAGRMEMGGREVCMYFVVFLMFFQENQQNQGGALGWPPWVSMQGRQRRMVRISAQSEACPEHMLPGDRCCSIEDLRLLGLTL